MSLKFLLDENIPYALIDLLQDRGFDVKHLKKMGKQGAKNGEVYEIAVNEKSWIVTRDADFQNLRRFYQYNVAGIVLFKLTRSKTEHLLSAMVRLLDKGKCLGVRPTLFTGNSNNTHLAQWGQILIVDKPHKNMPTP